MWLYAILFALLLPILFKWQQYLRNLWMVRSVPGYSRPLLPMVSSIINLYKMSKLGKDPTTASFMMRTKTVDDFREAGITVNVFNSRMIFYVFRADLIEEVLKSPHFAEKSRGYDFIKTWLGNGLLTAAGAVWKKQRRMLTPSFHFAILDDYEITMNKHSHEVIESMRADPSACRNVELSSWATGCTMSILLETVMGFDQNDPVASRRYINALNQVAHLFAKRFTRPWNMLDIYYYNSAEGKAYMKAVEEVHRFTDQAIDNKIRMFKENPELMEKKAGRRQAFLDKLVAMHLQDGSLSREEIREQTDTFMFAGHDTTGWNIAWALMQLGHLPHIQDKLQEEFKTVFGDDRERHVTQDDLKQLKYFDRVLKECQRIYPSVPSVSRRCVTRGAKLGPYQIPEESTLIIAMFHLHRDPKVFPDPLKFDPDRFLPENSKDRHPYAFIPFSAGARNCIGQRFAMQELRILLVNVLRNFRIRSLIPLDSVDLAGELILRAKPGLNVDFEPIVS